MSYAEQLFEESLRGILLDNEEIIKNYRPIWLKNFTGNCLEYDFYLPKWKIAFEIQGQHHYDNEYQKYKDSIKKQLSENNNISLFTIGLLNSSPSFIRRKLKSLVVIGTYIPLKPFCLRHQKIISDKIKKYKTTIESTYGQTKCQKLPSQNKIKEIRKEVFDFCKTEKYFEMQFKGKFAIFEYIPSVSGHKLQFNSKKFGIIYLKMSKVLQFLSDTFKDKWIDKNIEYKNCSLNSGAHLVSTLD